jgi:hypothetical protein
MLEKLQENNTELALKSLRLEKGLPGPGLLVNLVMSKYQEHCIPSVNPCGSASP